MQAAWSALRGWYHSGVKVVPTLESAREPARFPERGLRVPDCLRGQMWAPLVAQSNARKQVQWSVGLQTMQRLMRPGGVGCAGPNPFRGCSCPRIRASSFMSWSAAPPVPWFHGCMACSCGAVWIQGWITVFAALLLALITLLTSYSHVDLLGAASVDLPQQAGLPCIAAALELVAAGLAESVRP